MAEKATEFVIDPLAGVDDVEGDVDVEAEVRSALGGTGKGSARNPIKAAAKELRDEDDSDEPEADEAADDDADGGTDEAEEAAADDAEEDAAEDADEEEEKADEDEDAEDDADEDAEADDDADAEERPTGRTFAVEVPGQRRGEAFEFKGLTQEQHDVLRNHVARSQRLDVVNSQLGQLREHEQVATFVEDHPLEAMLLLDQQGKGVGEAFAEAWMKAHPEVALKVIQKLGYHDADNLDPERLKDRSEAAQGKNQKLVNDAITASRSSLSNDRFVNETAAMLKQIGETLELTGEDMKDFISLSAQKIKRVFDSRMASGRDPRLSQKEVVKLAQPVIRRFAHANGTGNGKPAGEGKGKAKVDVRERFAARDRVKTRHAKVSGGSGSAPALTSIQVSKFKGAKGVKEAADRLRRA